MLKRHVLVPAVLALALAGCWWQPRREGMYFRTRLVAVERSPQAGAAGGAAAAIAQPDSGVFVFEDELIRFRTRARPAGIRFRLLNKTGAPLTIVWNDAEFVDALGEEHRVMRAGRDFRRREHQPPSVVVAAGAEHRDGAIPMVRMQTPEGEVHQAVQVLPHEYDPTDRRVALRLPLEANGRRWVYTFWYRIEDRYDDYPE